VAGAAAALSAFAGADALAVPALLADGVARWDADPVVTPCAGRALFGQAPIGSAAMAGVTAGVDAAAGRIAGFAVVAGATDAAIADLARVRAGRLSA
jgi:hypothetical protein